MSAATDTECVLVPCETLYQISDSWPEEKHHQLAVANFSVGIPIPVLELSLGVCREGDLAHQNLRNLEIDCDAARDPPSRDLPAFAMKHLVWDLGILLVWEGRCFRD